MQRKKHKILSAFLSLCMIVSCMVGMSVTASADVTISNLWIGSSDEITAAGTVTGAGQTDGTATVSAEGDAIVVELNGFNYNADGYNDQNPYAPTSAAIYYNGTAPLTIKLTGTNTITTSAVASGNNYGIYCWRNVAVNIKGTGSLTVTSGNAGASTSGISTGGALTISGCTVNATGGYSDYKYATNAGITAGGDVTIDNATVTATGGTVVGTNPRSSGIEAFSGYTGSCNVIIKSGILTAKGNTSALYYGNAEYRTKLQLAGGSTLTSLKAGENAGSAANTTIDNITNQKYIYCEATAPSHTHSFSYAANGATITASCGTGCDITTGLTMTISAPTSLTYDGKAKAAALSADYNTTAFPGTYTIAYYKGKTALTGAPTDAGTYTAKVTVEGKTASVNYEITKADPTATAPTGLTATYGQTLANVTLTNPTGNTPGTGR